MNLAEALKNDIVQDEYFLKLFLKAELIQAYKLFNINSDEYITENEFNDLMRFSDILSHSDDPEARNKAYKIIALLATDFKDNRKFHVFANAILSKLGNFPALQFLRENNEYVDFLPIERSLEKQIKVETQQTSDGKSIFTDAQYKIRRELESHDYFSFSGPTSIGKSFIVKDYIRSLLQNNLSNDGIIVFLVPTRALIGQVVGELREEINDKGVNIASHPILSSYSIKKYKNHVFVFTPERLLSYVNSPNKLSIKYLFVDEAQKVIAINDSRSSLYYHAIYETIKKFATKLFFASPNIPNPDIFLKIFEKDDTGFLSIKEQTVAQNRYFIDLEDKKATLFSDLGQQYKIDNFPFNLDSKKLISFIGCNVNNIIYCNGIQETVTRAKDFAKTLEYVEETDELKDLISYISDYVHKDYYLIECLKKGVGFHHGRMPQPVRRKIEKFFKDRNSSLKYIFCTSTLLEGVNLPAKNIFVFNEGHGSHPFEKIDFENLIGRAGRLAQETYGNVICIKDDIKRWKKNKELLLERKELNNVASFILNKDKKNNFKNIGKALSGEDLPKVRVGEKDNIVHYSTLTLLHYIEDEKSVLKDNFLESNEFALDILIKSKERNQIPKDILKASSTIKPKYQNDVLNYIKEKKYESIFNIDNNNTDTIVQSLEVLYKLYNWDIEESSGREPLIPSGLVKKGYGSSRLRYWAMLMRNWTRAEPLNRLISFSLNYHNENGYIWIIINGQPKKEKFIGDQRQINIIIEKIMDDIENGLRFKIEKYFLNYYLISKHVLGSDVFIQDWSEFIEYGTTDRKIIELQNIGFSRGASRCIINDYFDFVVFDENDELVNIDEDKLLKNFDKKNEHYEEIIDMLS
jgi:replicative superfamily II helicase